MPDIGGGASTSAGLDSFSTTATWRAPYGQSNADIGQIGVGVMQLHPIIIPRRLSLSAISSFIYGPSASGSGGLIYTVIYNDANFFPTTLVASSGAVSTETSGSKPGAFAPITLNPGQYWVGVLTTVAASGPEGCAQATQTVPNDWAMMPHASGTSPGVNAGNDGTVAIQTGLTTPPATFAGSQATDSNGSKRPCWVCLKVAAI